MPFGILIAPGAGSVGHCYFLPKATWSTGFKGLETHPPQLQMYSTILIADIARTFRFNCFNYIKSYMQN